MVIYSRFLDFLEACLNFVTLLMYAIVVIVVAFQVLNRFYLHLPIVWTSDLSVVLFAWLAFLTTSKAVRRNSHFRLNALVDLLKGQSRKMLEIFSLLIGGALGVLMVIYGIEMTVDGLKETSPGLEVSMSWAYASVPICGLAMILYTVENVFLTLKEGPQNQDDLNVDGGL
jgi:TRAP-type C4-dicarboxylate transport system permease small subunit